MKQGLQNPNLLPEDVALLRWCPVARVANPVLFEENDFPLLPAYNRLVVNLEDDRCAGFASEYEHLRCVASRCMMWRSVADGRGFCGMGGGHVVE